MSAQGPDELRAVHAARRELGPDYDDALLDSFVDRAEAQLRRRLDDERPVARRTDAPTREPVHLTLGPGGLVLALTNAVWGVVSSLILSEAYHEDGGRLLVIWLVIALADAAYLGAAIARGADRRRDQQRRPAPPDTHGARPVPRPNHGRPTSS